MTEILKVPTKWDAVEPANPLQDWIIDIIESDTVTKEQVNKQANRVWPDEAHSATKTKKYHRIFATNLANADDLNDIRNASRFKHALARAYI